MNLQYSMAAGCVLALVGGIAVFSYLNLGTSEDSLAANKHFYAVKAGYWTDPSVWEGGLVPPVGKIKHDIEVLDRITRQGHLSYKRGSGNTLVVKDTLMIEGNFTLENRSNLIVHEGGVLMVAGDFLVDKKSEITNYGMIAVGGNWQVHSLAKIEYLGDSSQLFHLGDVLAHDQPIQFGQTAGGLQQEHVAVYTLVKQKSDALKPIFFTAVLQQGSVLTQWQAGNETAYTSFIVEKSTDGAMFEELVVISGEPNSVMHARDRHTDNNPPLGVSYYRLKRTDTDDNITYSKLVMVANWESTISRNGSVGQ